MSLSSSRRSRFTNALEHRDRNGLLEDVPVGYWEDQIIAVRQDAATRVSRIPAALAPG